MCGSLGDPPAGEGWAVAAEREHGEGDERFGFVESEGHAGEQSNLGVGGLDEPVGQVVVEGGVDGRPMLTMRRYNSTKAGMRQRRAQLVQLSSACLPSSPLIWNASRNPSLSRYAR